MEYEIRDINEKYAIDNQCNVFNKKNWKINESV